MNEVELRRAGPDDLPAILELNRAGNGDHIEVEMEVTFRRGGMAATDYAVAVVGSRVVATIGLLATRLRVGSVSLAVGQPEYVATDPEFRGQGLAGRLLELVGQWSEARGDLVQIIAGVPYFYRQYGYSYGLAWPKALALPPEHDLVLPPGWLVRAAEPGDVDRIQELQTLAQARADVALEFAANLWSPFLEMPAAPLRVGVTEARVEAVARLRLRPGWPVYVQALAASARMPVVGLEAMLAGIRAEHPEATLVVSDRDSVSISAVLGSAASSVRRRGWTYVRVPSLVALLSALTPVLDERVSRSRFAEANDEVTISWYRSSVVLRLEQGRIVEVAGGPAIHDPEEAGQVGLAPDLLPMLLFGEGGALALEDHPDVYLGRGRSLMAALFPPLQLDVLYW